MQRTSATASMRFRLTKGNTKINQTGPRGARGSRAMLAAGWLGIGLLLPCAASALDPTFGGDGIVTTKISAYGDYANALVLQPDGKLVAAGEAFNGTFFRAALARYNADGSLDPTFDGNGIVEPTGNESSYVFALALQPDGKLVAAGLQGGIGFRLARYHPNGSLDASFDGDGIATTPTATSAFGLVVQSDGKLVAAGGHIGIQTGFILARYDTDGSLDPSFDGDGLVTTPFGANAVARALVLQPDGKLVAAGCKGDGMSIDCLEFALARYNQDGSLDPSFDDDGLVTTAVGPYSEALALAQQPDGKLLAAGFAGTESASYLALTRYNPDGSLDGTFGVGGTVTTLVGPTFGASAIVVQPDGKLVAVGRVQTGAGYVFAMVRYNANGSVDGACGLVTTQPGDADSGPRALVLQPDGKLVAAGWAATPTLPPIPISDADFALVRYLPQYCTGTDIPVAIYRHFVAIKFPDLPPTPVRRIVLEDRFETQNALLIRPRHLLVPAVFTAGGTSGANREPNLMSWKIRSPRGEPKHTPQLGLRVRDGLGTLTLDTVRPQLLLVPATTDLARPPAPPDSDTHPVDNYKCYAVKPTKGTARRPAVELIVGDEFDRPRTLRLGRPVHLCTPVEFDGQVARNPPLHLLCYRAAPLHSEPPHTPVPRIFTASSLGELTVATKNEAEVCLSAVVEGS